MTVEVFNPLDKLALAESVESKLLEQAPVLLSNTGAVKGAGLYALYYDGSFPAYSKIAAKDKFDPLKPPIYVGKAIPKGGRKGGLGKDVANSTALKSRLDKHAQSIAQSTNLKLNDFFFRHLVVDDVWIPLGENMLIENFRPLWNIVVDGFGNNDPGKGRYNQKRSSWDVLHPGRSWTVNITGGQKFGIDQIEEKITNHLS